MNPIDLRSDTLTKPTKRNLADPDYSGFGGCHFKSIPDTDPQKTWIDCILTRTLQSPIPVLICLPVSRKLKDVLIIIFIIVIQIGYRIGF